MFEKFLESNALRGNWVDLVFIAVLLYFILTNKGFIHSFLELVGFIFSLVVSYKLYKLIGTFLVANFSMPRGISLASGFFIAWFLSEIVFYSLVMLVSGKIISRLHSHRLNRWFGFLPGALHAGVIFLFFISLVFAFPVRGQIKQDILNSRVGPTFVNLSQSTELRVKTIFGEAISETINFLTIKPQSNERIDLGFNLKEKKTQIDEQSETKMLQLVNQERTQKGLSALVVDDELREAARKYAEQMLVNGFFSHISEVDGSSPAERAEATGATFSIIGENLAYAPDVYIAHQGLMNSEGHRRNILADEFGRAGIGVIDGGIYGKMFVQEFAD